MWERLSSRDLSGQIKSESRLESHTHKKYFI
jgi:hypothetical protein